MDNGNTSLKKFNRVHIVNIITINTIALLAIFTSLASHGWADSKTVVLDSLIVFVISLVTYFTPVNENAKAVIYAMIPALVAISQFFVKGPFQLGNHYMMLLSITMIALYFNKRLVVVYAVLVNIMITILSVFVRDTFFMNQYFNIWTNITLYLYMNGILVILYLLTKWGNDLVIESENKEKEVTGLLGKLKFTMDEIDKYSDMLNDKVIHFNESINGVKDTMSNVNSAMQEMAKGVNEQAISLGSINESISQISDNVNSNLELTKEVSVNAGDMNSKITEGSAKLVQMDTQMKIIYEAQNASMTTVNELNLKITDINKFLESITQIADQTNLLSLNATIEAARAGEMGKGFAVVADEVRKLAEQSTGTVKDINTIINDIKIKVDDAVEKAKMGEDAATSGKEIIRDVDLYFRKIRDSFDKTSVSLKKEAELVSGISEKYDEIQEKTENIASISEENAASVEEVSATVENENNNIIHISSLIEETKELSEKLKTLVKG